MRLARGLNESWMSVRPDQVRLSCRVMPRARQNRIALDDAGRTLRIRLTAPPIEGRANRALLEFLSELLRVPISRMEVGLGEKSRTKTVCVYGVDAAQVRSRINTVLVGGSRTEGSGPDT